MRDLALYQSVIDRLVESCQVGQGQLGPRRAHSGLWNQNATSHEPLGNQWRMNQLLASLTADQREVLAEMLGEAFVGGVHETLVVLNEQQVTPFDDGYEGDPHHDFVGRLDGWDWPTN
jgi:hypothetical protein